MKSTMSLAQSLSLLFGIMHGFNLSETLQNNWAQALETNVPVKRKVICQYIIT